VFASQRESDRLWRLYLIHANGQDERALSRADGLPLFGEDPAWSHRDDRIIYRGCAPDGSQCGLWFITLDGLVSAPIALDATALQPDGSPAEDAVVFASNRSGNWEVYRVNLDGSDLRQLTGDTALDVMPTWSPDGEWIAFQSTRPGFAPENAPQQGPSQGGQTTDGNWGIWIMRKDGRDLRQIFAFDGGLMRANRLDLPYGSRDWYDEQISWGR
jgi:Tol biopolymer transport system component